jgi:DNA-directed RNA polymerase subunit RPC12/RpoP
MKSQKQKTKSKVTRFFETIGLALAVVWISPVIAYEGIKEHFEKKREEKKPQPKPIQFVCSECGETFEADNIEKEMRTQGSSENFYTYSSPQPCPKCGGERTCPTEADKGFYQRIWDMEETASFISHLYINWGHNDSLVDKGKREFKCTQCGSTFSALDIKPHPYSASFPSRCPHCQSIRTLPASDEDRINHYESIWLIMERAEKEREERKNGKKKVDLREFLGDTWGRSY